MPDKVAALFGKKNNAKLTSLNGKIKVNVQTTNFSCYASLRVREQILFTPNNPGKFVSISQKMIAL